MMSVKRTSILQGVLTIIVLLALTGCATTKRDWQEANRLGTIEAYELFLQKHPNADQANDAKRILPGLRADADWSRTEETNTIDAYEQFLIKHPQSRYAKLSTQAIESLRFKQAKAADSIEAYELYLTLHPDGSAVQYAQKRLRELRYAFARHHNTLRAYEYFLSQYSEGSDADTLRAELPSMRKYQQALELGNAIIIHAPRTFMNFTNGEMTGLATKRSDPTANDLSMLRTMLAEGADPNAVRVAGFTPGGQERLGGGVIRSSAGNPGQIVRAEEGGMTLLNWCRVNELDSIAKLLIKFGAR